MAGVCVCLCERIHSACCRAGITKHRLGREVAQLAPCYGHALARPACELILSLDCIMRARRAFYYCFFILLWRGAILFMRPCDETRGNGRLEEDGERRAAAERLLADGARRLAALQLAVAGGARDVPAARRRHQPPSARLDVLQARLAAGTRDDGRRATRKRGSGACGRLRFLRSASRRRASGARGRRRRLHHHRLMTYRHFLALDRDSDDVLSAGTCETFGCWRSDRAPRRAVETCLIVRVLRVHVRLSPAAKRIRHVRLVTGPPTAREHGPSSSGGRRGHAVRRIAVCGHAAATNLAPRWQARSQSASLRRAPSATGRHVVAVDITVGHRGAVQVLLVVRLEQIALEMHN